MSVPDELHAALAPFHGERWGGDDAPLRAVCDAAGGMLEPLAALLRADGGPWSALGDPDRVPVEALPWLGQFVGVRVTRGAPAAQQREEIRKAAGWRRGTPGALVAAVAATLTGSRTVVLREQYTSAYTIRVETLAGETPDPSAAEAAALAQKPAGLVLDYATVAAPTWDDAASTSWDDAAGGTWDDDTAF